MIANSRARVQVLAQNGLFALLLAVVAGLVIVQAQQHSKRWDISQNHRNSLSEGSIQTLQQLAGPVKITAYATPQDPNLGDIRRGIADFLAPYQRVKPDITLTFVDPREQPKATADANVRVNGEMVIAFAGRSEHLTTLDEQSLTNLLTRLARSQERLVLFLEGHGERKPDSIANHDLGEYGKRLQSRGFRIGPLNLAAAQDVPTNAALLVIANPQVDLLPVEVQKLRAYLDRGGPLLWLVDQESLHGLQPIADFLGLQLTPGVVVDPAANDLKASATLAIASSYGMHPATRGFTLNTAFPVARRIGFNDANTVWHFAPLVEAAPRGWVETGALDGKVAFDASHDTPGPVVVAAAFERDRDGKQQRVVVTGSGNFLANTYAGMLGNLDLGVALVEWLSGDENLISLQPKPLVDGDLEISRSALLFIAVFFLFALPLFFLFTGGMIWWRRRRA